MPWEHAAGSAARAPPRQEEDLETRLLGELHHFGVVTQIVVRLDPSDTAWVQFVDVCASAEVRACACCLCDITALKLLNQKIPDADGPHHVGQQQQRRDRAMQWPCSLTRGLQDALHCKNPPVRHKAGCIARICSELQAAPHNYDCCSVHVACVN